MVVRRLTGEKISVKRSDATNDLKRLLDETHQLMLNRYYYNLFNESFKCTNCFNIILFLYSTTLFVQKWSNNALLYLLEPPRNVILDCPLWPSGNSSRLRWRRNTFFCRRSAVKLPVKITSKTIAPGMLRLTFTILFFGLGLISL